MSTLIREVGDMVEVSMFVSTGKRKKRPSNTVLVPKGDKEKLRAAIMQAAAEARVKFGIPHNAEVPVV